MRAARVGVGACTRSPHPCLQRWRSPRPCMWARSARCPKGGPLQTPIATRRGVAPVPAGRAAEQLLQINEQGARRRVELPTKLRGYGLQITPLPGGWTAAVARVSAGDPRQELECCRGIEEPEPGDPSCCAEWVFAQRSPTGRWTKRPAAAALARDAHACELARRCTRAGSRSRGAGRARAKTSTSPPRRSAERSGGRTTPRRCFPAATPKRPTRKRAEGGSTRWANTERETDQYKPAYIVERELRPNGHLGPGAHPQRPPAR